MRTTGNTVQSTVIPGGSLSSAPSAKTPPFPARSLPGVIWQHLDRLSNGASPRGGPLDGKRVVILAGEWGRVAGLEVTLLNQLRSMLSLHRGLEVHLVLSYFSDLETQRIEQPVGESKVIYHLVALADRAAELDRVLASEGPLDLLISTFTGGTAVEAIELARPRRIPVALDFMLAGSPHPTAGAEEIWRWNEKANSHQSYLSIDQAEGVGGVSSASVDVLNAKLRDLGKAPEAFRLGIDLDAQTFEPSAADRSSARRALGEQLGMELEHRFVVLSTQQPEPISGWIDIVEQVRRLVESGRTDVLAVLVNETEPHSTYQQQVLREVAERVAALRLEPHVRVLPARYDRAEMPWIHRAADVNVLPVQYGLHSQSAAESILMEVPAVGFALGGLKDVIPSDPELETLIEPGDHARMAQALARLYDDRPLGHRVGARARKALLERFPPIQVAEAQAGFYAGLIEAHRGRLAEESAGKQPR